MMTGKARVLGPKDGKAGLLGSMGVRFMIDVSDSGCGSARLDHSLPDHAQ